jgi:hypothetical protein
LTRAAATVGTVAETISAAREAPLKQVTSVAAVVLVAALTLAGVAAAGHKHHGHVRVAVKAHTAKVSVKHTGGPFIGAAVTYLAVDRATIEAGLKSGQSLAQIAVAHGKTADGLVAALIAPAKLKLDAAVAAGRLTSERETALLTKLQTAATKRVNATPKTHTGTRPVRVPVASILQPALTYLGLDFKGLVTQLRSGKTIAAVAVAQGKTAVGLVDAVVASAKTKLDARVAAGKLSAAAEATFLTQLQANVTTFVNG